MTGDRRADYVTLDPDSGALNLWHNRCAPNGEGDGGDNGGGGGDDGGGGGGTFPEQPPTPIEDIDHNSSCDDVMGL